MLSYLEESLKFQLSLGVDASFDFITGRELNIQNLCINESDIKTIEENMAKDIKHCKSVQTLEKDKTINYDSLPQEENNYNIDEINTIDALVEKIQNFNGCQLKRYSKNDVIYDGKVNSKIILIGEAPGETEDINGIPFCGQSGKLLRKALKFIDLSTDNNLLITNCVYWRPPMNRKPDQDEINSCLPFVYKMIEIVDPELIILCGATAISTLLQTNKRVSDMVGNVEKLPKNNLLKNYKEIKTYSIYHPSYLLRNPSMKKVFWQHLIKLKTILQDNNIAN